MATYTAVIPNGQANYSGWFIASANAGDTINVEADDAFTVSAGSSGTSGATTTPGVAASGYVPASGTFIWGASTAFRVFFTLENYGGTGSFIASGFSWVADFLIESNTSGNIGVKHVYFDNITGYEHSVYPLVHWVGECGRTAQSDSDWLTVVLVDHDGFHVHVSKNETGQYRTAEIVCTSFSGKEARVTYTQRPFEGDKEKYVKASIADGSSSVISPSGGVFTLNVEANTRFDVEFCDSLSEMGATSNILYGDSDSLVEIYVPASDGTERSGTLAIVSDANDEDIFFTITQGVSVDYSYLEMTVEPLTVPAEGGTVTVNIETNGAWDFDCEALRVDWGGELPLSTGTGSASFELEIPRNDSDSERSAVVVVTGGGESRTATVVQLAEAKETPVVELSPSSGVLSASGGALGATITANEAAGALSASTSSSWLSASIAVGELIVVVEKNESETSARSGAVTVSGENGGSATFSVTQMARSESDNVRLIPWSVSDGAAYVLLISTMDGAQTISVYDAATKEAVATFDSDYPNESLGKIRYKSSNDVIWIVHPERPVRWVKREDGDPVWNGTGYDYPFVFSYEDYPFMVEPMLDFNVGGQLVTLISEPYEISEYHEGDIVYSTNQMEITSEDVDFVFLEKGTTSQSLECNIPSDYGVIVYGDSEIIKNVKDGDTVEIRGLSVSVVVTGTFRDVNNEFVSHEFWRTDISSPIVGVVRKSTTGGIHVILGEVTISATADEHGDYPVLSYSSNEEANSDAVVNFQGVEKAFYECIKDVTGSNVSVPLTDETYWRKTYCVGKRLFLRFSAAVSVPEDWRLGQHFALTAKAYAAESGNWDYSATGKVSDPLLAFGSVTLKTEGGIWSGRLILEMSLDDGKTWEFVDAVVSENGSANPQVTVDVDEIGALVRVRCDRREKATTRQALIPSDGGGVSYKTVENDTGCKWTLTCEGYSDIFVKVVERGYSYNEWIVECISGCPYPVSTTTWAEGAWNSRYGYPQTVTLHEERLCFAGNTKKPTTLWCSAINHYDDFRRGTLDTSSLSVKPSSHSYGRAVWLASGAQLIMGTTLEEFSIGSRDSVAAMSGSNIVAKSSASYGSADFDCVQSKSGIFSVLPGGKKIGVLNYDAVEEYTGTEVSQRAESLLESGVKELSYVKAPQETLYALCEDGTVAVLTYDFGQNVAGWSQFEILDGVLSMCAVRRGSVDVLVFVVNKDGELVLGEINPASDVWQDDGVSYLSECYPMPMDVSGNVSAGITGKITQADVYLTKGCFFEYSFDGKTWHKCGERTKSRSWKELFGRIELRQSSDWKDEATVMFRTDYDAPFTIAAVGAEIKRGS